MKKTDKKIKNNNKGFSLIELVVVMALVIVLTTIASMPLVNIYKARAKSAAETVNSMMSQSKINALSGTENEMWLYYDNDAKHYVCLLRYTNGDTMGEIYKTETFGNANLTIKIGSHEWPARGAEKGLVRLKFDCKTGKITSFWKGTYTITNGVMTAVTKGSGQYSSKIIKFISDKEYDIKLTEETGLIELEYKG